MRMSVHDPVMPINFESSFKGGNAANAKWLLNALKKYGFLNLKNLENFTK